LSYRLGELATLAGAQLRGDGDLLIERVDTLEQADTSAICFVTSPKYLDSLRGTRAGAVILHHRFLADCPVSALVSDNPHLIYARVAGLLNPLPEILGGVHPTAVVAESAIIDRTAWVGPHAVVEEGARIGPNVFIGAGSVIGAGVVIEEESRLVARVVLCAGVHIGKRALIHPGAVVGSDGFGFARDGERWVRVPQLGTVVVGDDVEIGANTTVDRGALMDTLIRSGAKLDNQIQIAHNVEIGENSALAACVGIAGSTKVGRNCTLGGGVGLAGHLEFADGVHFTGQSLVTRSFKQAGQYSGNLPAVPTSEWRRSVARIRNLDETIQRLKELEQRVKLLESGKEEES